ncbi:MAG: hypothetical protein E2O39_10990 [Planctomycetota bacterium]|nr:MAG: hypothetical protein E2O39_10990 [Planctomycetota bacterium]
MSSKKTREAVPAAAGITALQRRHLRVGWWSIVFFITMGTGLELMHGLKVDWYLNVANETRRLMFTLAHAHGVLIGALHVGYAFTLGLVESAASRAASGCLTAATILLPGGFLLGGIVVYGGDPGRGILLVPVGAALLLVAALITAVRVTRAG